MGRGKVYDAVSFYLVGTCVASTGTYGPEFPPTCYVRLHRVTLDPLGGREVLRW